jgi:hypothetical protein
MDTAMVMVMAMATAKKNKAAVAACEHKKGVDLWRISLKENALGSVSC